MAAAVSYHMMCIMPYSFRFYVLIIHSLFYTDDTQGNSGDEYYYPDVMMSTSDPAIGKNVIAVGATESFGGNLDSEMLGRDYLAQFSSRGPTPDNRIKPDILAPGFYMLSANANSNECDPAERPEVESNKPMGGLKFSSGKFLFVERENLTTCL